MVNRLDPRDRSSRSVDDLRFDVPPSAAVKASKPTPPSQERERQQWQPHASYTSPNLSLLVFDDSHSAFQRTKIAGCGVEASRTKAPPPPGPSSDDVLYVGTNSESVVEEKKALRGLVGAKHVVGVDATVKSTIVVDKNGISYDLNTVKGRKDFVAMLGVSDATAAANIEMLLTPKPTVFGITNTTELQALAHIAMAWAPAERGEAIPSRLLISGHSSNGTNVGGLSMASVAALARAMKNAAHQVEDVCFSACSSVSNAANEAEWSKAFPNLKTIWSYNGKAPSPGTVHFGAWTSATAGRKKEIWLSSDLKKADVAVWSAKAGYQDKDESLKSLLTRAAAADERFQAFLEGTSVPSEHSQPADEDYRTYRKLSMNKGVSDEKRIAYEKKADQLLRIRFYPKVREVFARTYDAKIKAAYAAAYGESKRAPDFATLSRAEARKEIDALTAKLKAANIGFQFVDKELAQFRNLDRELVSQEWFIR